jgi:hypothetical protein
MAEHATGPGNTGGIGRPPGTRGVIRAIVQKLAVERPTAAMILSQIDESGLWRRHLTSEDSAISLKALVYLTDRRDGRAVEYRKTEDVTCADPKQRIRELLGIGAGSDSGDADGKADFNGSTFSSGFNPWTFPQKTDRYNTGWDLYQPDIHNFPYSLELTVTQAGHDGLGFTVGYRGDCL